MAGPRYIAPAAEEMRIVALDGLSALYHAPSGMTHIVAPPAPEILDALQPGPAYIAELILHRYKVLGLLDGEGRAIGGAGALALPESDAAAAANAAPTATPVIAGQACPSCGAHAYIRKDGCMFCTACGHQGECG